MPERTEYGGFSEVAAPLCGLPVLFVDPDPGRPVGGVAPAAPPVPAGEGMPGPVACFHGAMVVHGSTMRFVPSLIV